MLHHQNRIPFIPEGTQQPGHAVYIPWVHPGAWLIENIEHAREGAPHVAHQLQALCLPAGQGSRFPVQGKVREADLDHAGQGHNQALRHRPAPWVCDCPQNPFQFCQLHLTHLTDIIPGNLTGQGRPV